MCDFSCYGGSCEEWLALEQTLPPAAKLEMPSADMIRLANEEREAIVKQSMTNLGPRVRIQNYPIPSRDGTSIQLRSYRPVKTPEEELTPLYIHFQGGGFMYGSLDGEDAICARIAIACQVTVLNVDYRHTPDFAYPTQWNDAEDAFVWAHNNMDKLKCDPRRVIVGGISAGAWLAASLVLQRHLNSDRAPIAGSEAPIVSDPPSEADPFLELLHEDINGIHILEIVRGRYNEDAFFGGILKDLPHYKNFHYANGLLFLHEHGFDRLCVPNVISAGRSVREIIISHAHSLLAHLGNYKTLWLLRDHVWWKSMASDVRKFCETCETCKRSKPDNQKPYGLLNPLPVPSLPWEAIGMDFVGPLPPSENHDNLRLYHCDHRPLDQYSAPRAQQDNVHG